MRIRCGTIIGDSRGCFGDSGDVLEIVGDGKMVGVNFAIMCGLWQ